MLFELHNDPVVNDQDNQSEVQLPFQGCHCQVEYSAGGDILFVQCQHAVHCPHQLLFGGGCICKNQARLHRYRQQH